KDAEPAGYRESRPMLAPTGRRQEDLPPVAAPPAVDFGATMFGRERCSLLQARPGRRVRALRGAGALEQGAAREVDDELDLGLPHQEPRRVAQRVDAAVDHAEAVPP